MQRPGAPFGGHPVRFGVGGGIPERRRRHQDPVGRFNDLLGERPGGVEPMAVEADVEIMAPDPFHREPIDEFGRRFAGKGIQHLPPGGDLLPAPAVEAAADGFDPVAGRGVQVRRARIQQPGQRPDQLA